MKANELMIGDWVYGLYPNGERYPHPFRIAAVDIYPTNKSPRIVTVGGYGFQEEHLAPIPLTAEILEKNGFEELMSEGWESAAKFGRIPEPTGVWQYGFGQFDSVSYLPKRSFLSVKFMEGCTADMANIKYVHELQHALRLCGVEKEIIL